MVGGCKVGRGRRREASIHAILLEFGGWLTPNLVRRGQQVVHRRARRVTRRPWPTTPAATAWTLFPYYLLLRTMDMTVSRRLAA